MSGEITVTRGYTWTDGERATTAKLNQTAAPVARVDEDAITSTELLLDGSGSAADTALAGVLSAVNLFRNPNLIYTSYIAPDEQEIEAGDSTENAIGWYVSPAGGTVTTSRSTKVPDYGDGGRVSNSLEIAGADAVTTVDIGQRVAAWVSGPLTGDFTVSAWIYNATGASFTPVIRVGSPASTINGFDSVSVLDSQNLSACANQTWTKVSYSFDGSGLDLTKGATIEIRIPSGSLDATGKVVRLTQWQLVPAAAAAVFVPPAPEPVLNRWDATGAPTVNDDAESGFSVGSLWHYTAQLWQCMDPTTGAAVWQLMSLELHHSLIIAHTQASGTDGGTATSGSWEIEPFNTILEDTAELEGDAENPVIIHDDGAFTLPAGLWHVDIRVPRQAVNQFRARLFNVTGNAVQTYVDNTTEMYGTNGYANSTNVGFAYSLIRGRFLLTDNTKLRVETRVTTTKATTGKGVASSLSTEVYAQAHFRRLVI